MMPRPIMPTRLPVSSKRSKSGELGWGRHSPADMERNNSPAWRVAISIIPKAHSATPYEDPLVVSTTLMRLA